MKRLVLFSLLSACVAHAGIKKVDGPEPAPKAAPEPPKAPPAPPKGSADLLEELQKRAPKGGRLQMTAKDMEELFRKLLEKQGMSQEELKNKGLEDLLRLMEEKNPGGFPGLNLEGPGMGRVFGRKRDTSREKLLVERSQSLFDGLKPGTVKASPATFVLRDGAKKSGSTKKDKTAAGEPKPLFGNLADLFNSSKGETAPDLVLGTAVQADGWILTKASEAKEAKELQCKVKGEWVAAQIVRVWEDDDLALVKVAAKDLPTVQWSKKAIPDLGSFISAVAPDGRDPMAIGVVSVSQRNLKFKDRGFLGVQLETDDKGLRIKVVPSTGAAFGAGVLVGDHILEVDGQKPASYFAFTKIVGERKPGDKLKLKLQRGADVVDMEIKLGGPPKDFDLTRPMDNANNFGSILSKRRDGFPAVVQADFPLNANQCGGPVTDLDGNVLGMVIARSGRVETLFLPSETVLKRLGEVDFVKESDSAVKAAAPKVDAKAAPTTKNEPKTEVPAKAEAAKTDSTKTDAAKVEAKAEPAKTEAAPKADAGKK